jgi:cell wall-associated NlpC family hydrolase
VRVRWSPGRISKNHVAAVLIGLASLVSALGQVDGDRAAQAAPAPTVAEVKAKIARLTAQIGQLSQQYDQVLGQLAQASQRLAFLDKQTAGYLAAFDTLQHQVGRIAALAYEQGGADQAIVVMLTTTSPQRVLSESSILSELATADGAQVRAYLAASKQLLTARRAVGQVRAGILKLRHSLGGRLKHLKALQASEEALLAQLSPPQQTGLGPGGGTGRQRYHGPTKTQAEKAVAFAYNALGCPYVFGGTGPCRQGFDCSGLTMSAWASAGISIPRVSYDQMSSLPAVSLHTSSGAFTTRYLEAGDVLGFAGNSHVGLYVGGGWVIDAPIPGKSVEKVALSGWYLSNLDGAVRP